MLFCAVCYGAEVAVQLEDQEEIQRVRGKGGEKLLLRIPVPDFLFSKTLPEITLDLSEQDNPPCQIVSVVAKQKQGRWYNEATVKTFKDAAEGSCTISIVGAGLDNVLTLIYRYPEEE